MTVCDVAVIGAGPYGLSGATHLRAANGLVVRVFGEPMSFWERHVPAGMLLRSPWAGSHISDPKRELTLDTYHLASSNHPSVPVPVLSADRDVLVDAASRRRDTELSGRTSTNVVVNLPGPAAWIGRTIAVRVQRAGPHSVWGEACRDS